MQKKTCQDNVLRLDFPTDEQTQRMAFSEDGNKSLFILAKL